MFIVSLHANVKRTEVGKAQPPQLRKLRCALIFLFLNIAEVALRTKIFKFVTL